MNRRKKHHSNITFIIFTFNEEDRIEYPVKCFLPYGKVLVVDNYSRDDTCKVAKKLGAEILRYKNPGWVETKEESDYIFKRVKTDWVYWGFADEMVPKSCLELYRSLSCRSKYKIVIQKRKTFLFDLRSEFLPCDVSVNFFRKDSIDFSNNVIHQTGKFRSHVRQKEILYLPPVDEYSVYHFSRYTTESLMTNFNQYTTIDSKSIPKDHLGFRILTEPLFHFFYNYFYRGSFKYGIKGFIVSVQYSIYPFLMLAKAYELKQGINPESIEKNFIRGKKKLLVSTPASSYINKSFALVKMFFLSRIHKYYKFRNR